MLLQHGREWAPASGSTPARVWHHDRCHLTSVHLHISGAAEQKHRPGRVKTTVKSESLPVAAGSSQLAGPWVPAWGASVSRGHMHPRRPARAIAVDGT